MIEVPYRVFRYPRPSSKRYGFEQTILYLIWEKIMRGLDLLHCHAAYPHGYVGALYKKIMGTPLIITSHGDLIKGTRARENRRFARRITKAFQLADAVTAVSYYMKEQSLDAGAQGKKILVIPNGIDLKEFQTEERFIFKAPYLFSMGILRKVKGFDILIQAFKEVKKNFPQISLLIGGGGKEEGRLKELAHDLGMNESIHFLGVVSGRDKIKLLKGCEFYICSAIAEEPFSNSSLEAFASGKTVVASNVGGIPELVSDGVNGLLVSPSNVDLLAKRIIELLRQPSLIQKMSLNAQQKSKEFDLEIVMNKYLQLYEKILNLPSNLGSFNTFQPEKVIARKRSETE